MAEKSSPCRGFSLWPPFSLPVLTRVSVEQSGEWDARGGLDEWQPPPPFDTWSFPWKQKYSSIGSDGRRHLQVNTPDPFIFPLFWGSC